MSDRYTPTLFEGEPLPATSPRLDPALQPNGGSSDAERGQSPTSAIPVPSDNAGDGLRNCVFVARDYSEGNTPAFSTELPPPLHGRISQQVFENTIRSINEIFRRAETLTSQLVLRNCMSCMTGYLMDFCLENPYEQHMRRLSTFVLQEDETVYRPLNLRLVDPLERGLRCVEIRLARDFRD
eukprot:m.104211 g.104211  ORF g.104211 m.104211 type:complete len:182 (-) comp18874_c0_seq2:36-581(-)